MAIVSFDLEAFDKTEIMSNIRTDLKDAKSKELSQHVIPFKKLGGLDESIMVFRLLTQDGYHVGSHQEGMLVKW